MSYITTTNNNNNRPQEHGLTHGLMGETLSEGMV